VSARLLEKHDQAARHPEGKSPAVIFLDQRKGEIDRGDTGGAEDRPVAHKDAVRLHPHLGKRRRQPIGILPRGDSVSPDNNPALASTKAPYASSRSAV
jgi:hypothetical protein